MRADIYAVGAVGYFLLTGTTVFQCKNVMEICVKHQKEIPEPVSKRLKKPIDPKLEAIVMRCLSKSPADRPQAAEMITELWLCPSAVQWTPFNSEVWWNEMRGKPSPSVRMTTAGIDATLVVKR